MHDLIPDDLALELLLIAALHAEAATWPATPDTSPPAAPHATTRTSLRSGARWPHDET